MKNRKKPEDRSEGRYSRRRLALLACVWLLAGGAVVSLGALDLGAQANDPRGCDGPPCAFPAQSNVGGIILATDFLQGESLVAFGVGDDETDPTPPQRALEEEANVKLGVNDIDAENFFIYKSWYYFDERVEDDVPVYLWANASSATLTGSGECGDGEDTFRGSNRCDLQANASETSAHYVFTEIDAEGLFSGWAPDYGSIERLWLVNPEDDQCPATLDLSFLCLGLLPDGGTTIATVTAETGRVAATDFAIRTHRARAVRDDFEGADKRMTLGDAYLEMRYGKGADRRMTPSGSVDSMSGKLDWTSADDVESQFGFDPGSNRMWGQPVETDEGVSALSNVILCEGGGPNTVCVPDDGTLVNQEGMSYDNIHLLEDDSSRYANFAEENRTNIVVGDGRSVAEDAPRVKQALNNQLDSEEYNVELVSANEMAKNAESYAEVFDVIVVNGWDTDAVSGDDVDNFLDATDDTDTPVVFLHNFWSGSSYTSAVAWLSARTDDPNFDNLDEMQDTDEEDISFEILQDHPIWEGIGEEGDTVEMYTEGEFGTHAWWETYSGDDLGRVTNSGGIDDTPVSASVNDNDDHCLLSLGATTNEGEYLTNGERLVANCVEYFVE